MKNMKKISNCWKFIGGGAIASLLLASSFTTTAIETGKQVKISNSSITAESTVETEITNWFDGQDLAGNVFYSSVGTNDGNAIIQGFDGDAKLPSVFLSAGKNLKLKTSFSGFNAYGLDSCWGDVELEGLTQGKACDWEGYLDLSLAENLYGIADRCFLCQSKLTNIILPSSTQIIGDYALLGCSNLSSVAFYNEDPSWMDAAGGGISTTWISAYTEEGITVLGPPLKTIYVPDGYENTYTSYAETSTTVQTWYKDSGIVFKGLSEMPAAPDFSEPTHLSDIAILGISLGCGLGIPLLVTIILNAVTISKLNKQKKK